MHVGKGLSYTIVNFSPLITLDKKAVLLLSKEASVFYDQILQSDTFVNKILITLDSPLIRIVSGFTLEVGCGTGRLMEKIRERRHLLGVDISINMLSVARRKGFEVVLADAESLPFRSEIFDTIISGFGSLSCTDLMKTLEEIRRILRPGGKFGITLMNARSLTCIICCIFFLNTKLISWIAKGIAYVDGKPVYLFYTPKKIEYLCNKCGLKIEEFRSALWFNVLIPDILLRKVLARIILKISGKTYYKNFGFFLIILGRRM